MRFLRLLSCFVALGVSVAAKADTISDFSLNSTLYAGPAAEGTFDVDETTGAVLSGDLTISYDGQSLTLSDLESQGASNGSYDVVLGTAADPGDTFELVLQTASLKGYSGGTIATSSNDTSSPSFVDYEGLIDDATAGTFTLVGAGDGTGDAAQTPEMGTLILVLTGLAAGATQLRRRKDRPYAGSACRESTGLRDHGSVSA